MNKNRTSHVDILLVDDSPSDVLMAKEALSIAKLLNTVHVVTDGEAALDFLYRRGKHVKAPRPVLILLDLNLPKRTGREVLAEIKSDASLKSIPVIVLTTSQAEEDVLKAYEAHANCYITKPVDFDRFSHVIQSMQNYWFSLVTLPSIDGDEN